MKGKLFLKRRAVRITLWVVGAAMILFIATQIFVSQYLPGMIRKRIVYLVENGSDGLYKCSLGEVSLSVVGGTVKIKDLQIAVDSAKFKQLELNGRLPGATFRANLADGNISGVKLVPFILYKKIRIHTIKVEHPDITFHSHHNPEKERMKKKTRDLEKIQDEKSGVPDEPVSE